MDVSTYLTSRGFGAALLRRHAAQFGKALKQAYVAKHGEPPGEGWRRINGSDRLVKCYMSGDAHLFDETFEDLFGDAPLPPLPPVTN